MKERGRETEWWFCGRGKEGGVETEECRKRRGMLLLTMMKEVSQFGPLNFKYVYVFPRLIVVPAAEL